MKTTNLIPTPSKNAEGRRQKAEGQKSPSDSALLTSAFCLLPSAFTSPVRTLRPWLAILTFTLLAAANAAASQAIIHFQVDDTKEDQLVTIDLFDGNAPQTVANFKTLVGKKFYKGIVVHRVIPETLVQMGDPLSRKKDRSATGTGGPGYTLPAEIGKKHIRGAVAMAALPPSLNPSRSSNGSQFYIVLRPQPELDKDYTVFGQVTNGLEFLDSISRRGRDTNDYPLEKVIIRSIEIR